MKKKNQRRHCLYFDGASKHNPRKAGVGGIIFYLAGKENVTYEWGLGEVSNNKAEAYNPLMGTRIIKKKSDTRSHYNRRLSHNNRGNGPSQKSKQ